MFKHEILLRTRYGETDRMGYVYYGNYAQYYEVARVELMRTMGISYAELEHSGIIMPVLELHIRYTKPAYYDDEIRILCEVRERPLSKMIFEYTLFNSNNEIINQGSTTLVFVDKGTGRPIRCPKIIADKFSYLPTENTSVKIETNSK